MTLVKCQHIRSVELSMTNEAFSLWWQGRCLAMDETGGRCRTLTMTNHPRTAHVSPASSSPVVTSCQSRSFLILSYVLWRYTMPSRQILAQCLSQACNKKFILPSKNGIHSCCISSTEIKNLFRTYCTLHQPLQCPPNHHTLSEMQIIQSHMSSRC